MRVHAHMPTHHNEAVQLLDDCGRREVCPRITVKDVCKRRDLWRWRWRRKLHLPLGAAELLHAVVGLLLLLGPLLLLLLPHGPPQGRGAARAPPQRQRGGGTHEQGATHRAHCAAGWDHIRSWVLAHNIAYVRVGYVALQKIICVLSLLHSLVGPLPHNDGL